MIPQTTLLDNGLRVVTCKLPGFDSVYTGVFINAGSRNEDVAENGIAHAVEHLHFKQTGTMSSREIANKIEILGSNVNAYTSQNQTCYYITGLGSNIGTAVQILGDIITDSVFTQSDIDVERRVILQEISRYNDDPNSIVGELYSSAAYYDQAFGRPILGPSSFIENIEREHFVSFVDRFYVAENMMVVACGDVEHDAFVEMVSKSFANVRRGTKALVNAPVWHGGFNKSTDAKFEQVVMGIGWNIVPTEHADFQKCSMLSAAIGSGMSSPMFQEVREKRGLVYSVGTYLDAGFDYGEMNFHAGTTPDKVDEVVNVGCEVLRNAASYITDNDLLRAKNQKLVGIARAKESPAAIARLLSFDMNYYGYFRDVNERIAAINAVTKDDLAEMANAIFAGKPTIAMVGPVPDANYLDVVNSLMA